MAIHLPTTTVWKLQGLETSCWCSRCFISLPCDLYILYRIFISVMVFWKEKLKMLLTMATSTPCSLHLGALAVSHSCSPSLSTVSFYQNSLTFRQEDFYISTHFCLHNISLLMLGPADSLQLGLHAAGHSLHPCSVQLQLQPSSLCCCELKK